MLQKSQLLGQPMRNVLATVYYRRLVHVNGERPSAHLKAEWLAVKATLPAAVAPM